MKHLRRTIQIGERANVHCGSESAARERAAEVEKEVLKWCSIFSHWLVFCCFLSSWLRCSQATISVTTPLQQGPKPSAPGVPAPTEPERQKRARRADRIDRQRWSAGDAWFGD
jgi:hypothetical protein